MKPAPRHKSFPIGRVCAICGRGATQRLGGVAGAYAALLALGYEIDRTETLGMAHLGCLLSARRKKCRPVIHRPPTRPCARSRWAKPPTEPRKTAASHYQPSIGRLPDSENKHPHRAHDKPHHEGNRHCAGVFFQPVAKVHPPLRCGL